MTVNRYLLYMRLEDNGDIASTASLIDARTNKATTITNHQQCWYNDIQERTALLRIMRNSVPPQSAILIGNWLGNRDFVVFLSKEEYVHLVGVANGNNTRT